MGIPLPSRCFPLPSRLGGLEWRHEQGRGKNRGVAGDMLEGSTGRSYFLPILGIPLVLYSLYPVAVWDCRRFGVVVLTFAEGGLRI